MTILDFRIVLKDGTVVSADRVHSLKPILNIAHLKGNEIVDLRENDIDMGTGFHDRDETPVFENDLVEFTHDYWTHGDGTLDTITAVVTWDQTLGAWTLVNTKNSAFRVLLGKHIKNGTVIGRKG